MNIIHLEITTEDQFDFSKLTRVLTRSEETFEALKKQVGCRFQKGREIIKVISVERHICQDAICQCKTIKQSERRK